MENRVEINPHNRVKSETYVGANIENFLKDLLKAVAISLLAVLGGMAWAVIEILRR